jgi:hypothetical protein
MRGRACLRIARWHGQASRPHTVLGAVYGALAGLAPFAAAAGQPSGRPQVGPSLTAAARDGDNQPIFYG